MEFFDLDGSVSFVTLQLVAFLVCIFPGADLHASAGKRKFGDHKYISSAVQILAAFATQLKLFEVALFGTRRAWCLFSPANRESNCPTCCIIHQQFSSTVVWNKGATQMQQALLLLLSAASIHVATEAFPSGVVKLLLLLGFLGRCLRCPKLD